MSWVKITDPAFLCLKDTFLSGQAMGQLGQSTIYLGEKERQGRVRKTCQHGFVKGGGGGGGGSGAGLCLRHRHLSNHWTGSLEFGGHELGLKKDYLILKARSLQNFWLEIGTRSCVGSVGRVTSLNYSSTLVLVCPENWVRQLSFFYNYISLVGNMCLW